jgi:hypothetical protein
MHQVVTADPPVPSPDRLLPGVLPSTPISMKTEASLTRYSKPAMRAELAAVHDATLVVAALEDIESRRAAIEWLLEAGLLGQCLG